MNRTLLIAAVCLGAFVLIDIAASTFVGVVWRTRAVAPSDLPPHVRARRLFLFRLIPSVFSAVVTLFVVAPAFAVFEPAGHQEELGPFMAVLAVAGVWHAAAALFRAMRSLWLTARFEHAWLEQSERIQSAIGLHAFAVRSPVPLVALVGVFAPKLIAARTVIDACSDGEVAQILAHERGHLDSRDNLKRWMMASLPDALRWTPMHREILDAWHHATEDAADDAATRGESVARAELAALLLKIIKLAPQPSWNTAIVSPFVEAHGLERRVRRLLKPEVEPPAPLAVLPMAAAAVMAIAIATTLASPGTLAAIFRAFERLVALGR